MKKMKRKPFTITTRCTVYEEITVYAFSAEEAYDLLMDCGKPEDYTEVSREDYEVTDVKEDIGYDDADITYDADDYMEIAA